MNMNLAKRIVSLVLTLALLMGNFPMAAFATEEEIPAPTEAPAMEATAEPTEAVTEETAAATEVPVVAETVAPTETPTEPVNVVASGTCGENLTWTLDKEQGEEPDLKQDSERHQRAEPYPQYPKA